MTQEREMGGGGGGGFGGEDGGATNGVVDGQSHLRLSGGVRACLDMAGG